MKDLRVSFLGSTEMSKGFFEGLISKGFLTFFPKMKSPTEEERFFVLTMC